ncbi:MAG: VWA containing CoxE family protein [Deltaproteobacteria bacterium]|nr:VWA containing CoxE family protein [Deltaproteobacteria bacterium]
MFDRFLYNLRAQGLRVGLSEWLRFLEALEKGLASDLESLYPLGRSLLVHSEVSYDDYDLAFSATFGKGKLDPLLVEEMKRWLASMKAFDPSRPPGQHDFESLEKLLEAMKRTLEEQTEEHDGGNRWIGTGGTSPYGTGGRANMGLQLGEGGGGRSGVRLADERRWQNYRTDLTLGVRDFKVALRALRNLIREGREVLDLDETIDETARNAGDIELVMGKERRNRVRVALFMDTGGSMAPHTELVSQLFTAATETKTFKTFESYYFHNCVYQWLYSDYETYTRVPSDEVLRKLTPDHRLIFVGDASMAPWELFTAATTLGRPAPSGLDRLRAFKEHCPASIWLNPDPERFWDHPTVSAIKSVFPMHPLTVAGMKKAIEFLRAPR